MEKSSVEFDPYDGPPPSACWYLGMLVLGDVGTWGCDLLIVVCVLSGLKEILSEGL